MTGLLASPPNPPPPRPELQPLRMGPRCIRELLHQLPRATSCGTLRCCLPQNGASAHVERAQRPRANLRFDDGLMLGSWLGSLARLLRVCDAESWSVTGVQVAERITTSPPSIVLIAGVQDPVLASLLEGDRYGVVQVPTGMLALEWARDFQPDAIILDNELPDMTGVEACRLLYGDLRIGGKVPILILAADGMSAEQRLSALRAGARDVLPRSHDSEDLLRKLQTYVRTKRAADAALGEGAVYATAGMHTRPGLVRRARELGALIARKHGALAW